MIMTGKRKERVMAYDTFPLTQRTIFGLLGRNLFGVAFRPEENVDWDAVITESGKQAVFMQVFADCGQLSGLTPEHQERIRKNMLSGFMKNARNHAQHSLMHRLLSAGGISYTTLKGAASARYYPDPQSRIMGDVDFYVDKSDLDRAVALFQKEGFEASGFEHISHVILRKERIHMEMHHVPAGVPEGDVGKIIMEYLSDLREQAVLVENQSVTCRCPSDFHHGLIMLMHLQHHLLAEGVGLRHLCDWAVFVSRFREAEFVELFAKRLKRVGLWRLARLMALCAALYLGLPEQRWMRESRDDDRIARALMEDIIAGGNFGSKDPQRFYEGLFISNRGKGGVKNNRLQQGIQALNRITRQEYPALGSHALLLPVGWCVSMGRYLKNNIKRRKNGKKIDTFDAYKKSAPRISLYQRLDLYEPEQ